MLGVKGKKAKLTLTKEENYVIITPFSLMDLSIYKRWKIPFQTFRDGSFSVRNYYPCLKNGLIPVHNGIVNF